MAGRLCPNCGKDGGPSPECPACGLVFAKWKPRGPAVEPAPVARTHAEDWHMRRLMEAVKGVGWFAAAMLLVWAVIRPPAGLPLPAGALTDDELGFAVAVPPGWKVSRKDVARPETVLALEAVPESADAWLQAVVVEGDGLPDDLAPGERRGLPKLLGAAFGDATSDLSYLKPLRVRVDNLKALRLEGDGSRTTSQTVQSAVNVDPWVQRQRELKGLPPTPVEMVNKVVEDKRRIRFVVQAVAGAGRRYAVGVIGEEAAFLDRRAEVDAWLDSFRVTTRPYSVTHLMDLAVRTFKGEFIQQTVMTAIVLLWAMSRWLFSGVSAD